jgi:hypothetical protein
LTAFTTSKVEGYQEAGAAEWKLVATEAARASEEGLSKEEQDKEEVEEEVGSQSVNMS